MVICSLHHCQVSTHLEGREEAGLISWCLLVQRGTQPPLQRRFQLLLVTYVYSLEEETFVAAPDMPADLPPQLCAAVQHLHQITSGVQSNSQRMRCYQLLNYTKSEVKLSW